MSEWPKSGWSLINCSNTPTAVSGSAIQFAVGIYYQRNWERLESSNVMTTGVKPGFQGDIIVKVV